MNYNYARNKKSKQLIFFTGNPPSHLVLRPTDWAVWMIPDAREFETMYVIGEDANEHCARNGHRTKSCKYCRAPAHPNLQS